MDIRFLFADSPGIHIKKHAPSNKQAHNGCVLKSVTTSRTGGMRKAPGRGRDHALLVVADFSETNVVMSSET